MRSPSRFLGNGLPLTAPVLRVNLGKGRHHVGEHGRNHARRIAETALPPKQVVELAVGTLLALRRRADFTNRRLGGAHVCGSFCCWRRKWRRSRTLLIMPCSLCPSKSLASSLVMPLTITPSALSAGNRRPQASRKIF